MPRPGCLTATGVMLHVACGGSSRRLSRICRSVAVPYKLKPSRTLSSSKVIVSLMTAWRDLHPAAAAGAAGAADERQRSCGSQLFCID